ncbi:uncharacterized protein Pyn_00836 [Prunus yedoensis var. nudiflora]|uniref:Uncharacterized protein n=1 Tax=Prunus yedoensis var. nudiflora TaxID=2094558 RepID=A0A314ZC06_PRUYE|nr:uncharacterized protein Pyn_00836 [Prunus yedoensis var. nudiflora]
MPSISVAEGEMKDSKMEELSKQNIRASSIPRPRAVLSSPGFVVYTYLTDVMIWNLNS